MTKGEIKQFVSLSGVNGAVIGAALGLVIVMCLDNPTWITGVIAPILGASVAFIVTRWVARHVVECVKSRYDPS